MDCSSGSWMTVIIVLILLPAMYASPISAGNNSTTELLGNQSKDDCLANQFLDINNVCVNCTYCHPGEEHSSQQKCGYGKGVSMTCIPCDDEYYQTGEGYSKLECRRCVTCDSFSEILQECTSTQDRQCGPCPENYYEYSPNLCLECHSPYDHDDCAQMNATPEPPPPSTNQSTAPSSSTSSPTSFEALPTNPPSSSLPSGDTEGTTSIPEIVTGSLTTKGVWIAYGLGAFIVIILICACVYLCLQYKTGAGTPSTGNTHNSASYKPVATISKDQPSTSSAADPADDCTPGDVLPGQPLLQPEREHLVRGSQPDNRSADFPSSEVNDEYLSTPHTLSISGGIIRSGVEMYPNLAQGGHMSPDRVPESPGSSPSSPNSPQVNFSFEYDDHQNGSSHS